MNRDKNRVVFINSEGSSKNINDERKEGIILNGNITHKTSEIFPQKSPQPMTLLP